MTNQRKKWRERLEDPDERMISDAAAWGSCYILEKMQSVVHEKLYIFLYSPDDPSPRDIELMELGIEFYLALKSSDYTRAKQVADKIDVVFESLVPPEWRKQQP